MEGRCELMHSRRGIAVRQLLLLRRLLPLLLWLLLVRLLLCVRVRVQVRARRLGCKAVGQRLQRGCIRLHVWS